MALSMPAQQHQHHLNGTLYACTTTPASPQWHAPCLHNTSITSMARSMPHNNTSMAEGIRWAASTWLTEHSTAVCYGRGTPFRFSCSTHLDLIFSLQQNGIPCERSHIHFAAEWNPQAKISHLVCSKMESPVKDLTFNLQHYGIPSERSHVHFAAEWNPQ